MGSSFTGSYGAISGAATAMTSRAIASPSPIRLTGLARKRVAICASQLDCLAGRAEHDDRQTSLRLEWGS